MDVGEQSVEMFGIWEMEDG